MQCSICGDELLATSKPTRLNFDAPQNPQRKTDSQLMWLTTAVKDVQPTVKREAVIDEKCLNRHGPFLNSLAKAGLIELNHMEP